VCFLSILASSDCKVRRRPLTSRGCQRHPKYDGYEPRAAFYTDKMFKMQTISARNVSTVRKNFQRLLRYGAGRFKKNWNSDKVVT
jgi:hypothetical protein